MKMPARREMPETISRVAKLLRGTGLPLVMSLFVLSAVIGCGSEPERTQDPAEIEKLRQEHVQNAQREWEDNQQSRQAEERATQSLISGVQRVSPSL